jgi:starvation-inducible outer membrane lipoprotein
MEGYTKLKREVTIKGKLHKTKKGKVSDIHYNTSQFGRRFSYST